MPDIIDDIKDSLSAAKQRQIERDLNEQHVSAFKDIDRRQISMWEDKDLAEWQSRYPPGSPQFIIAEHEWQRRLMADQIKTVRKMTIVNGIFVIIGVIIGSFLR